MRPEVRSLFALLLLIASLCYVFGRDTEGKGKECAKDEKWNDCGVLWWCEATCAQPEGRGCPKICSPGCFCVPPKIRRVANGTCIAKDDCKCHDHH